MSGGNSIYSPLPQSNSDSDESSEEELHSSHEGRVINENLKLSQNPKLEIILNGQRSKITNYKPLDNDQDIGIILNGFQNTTNEVSILKPNSDISKLSFARKIWFGLSLFLCVFTIVVFLWIIPCDVGSCPSDPILSNVGSWEKRLDFLELYGPVNVVPSAVDKRQNLIFLMKSFDKDKSLSASKDFDGGIISLLGHNGEMAWYKYLKRQPRDIDCHVIDVNRDGYDDCLIVGNNNLLKAVQADGIEIWDIHSPDENSQKPYDFDFPVILPDLDGDQVNELLTSCSLNRGSGIGSQNYLIIISGRIGKIISGPMQVENCSGIHNLMLDRDLNITYTCELNRKEAIRTISLPELCSKMNCPFKISSQINQRNMETLRQHKTDSKIQNVFQISGRRLLLDNRGRCPEVCGVTVKITDEREGRNQSIYSYACKSCYGMVPVTISFGKISGFVLKFWHWHSSKGNFFDQNQTTSDGNYDNYSSKFSNQNNESLKTNKLKQSEILNENMFSEGGTESKRYKRKSEKILKMFKRSKENSTEAFSIHRISERVVLFTFNETDSHFVNASQLEITQLCIDRDNCQPDLDSQKRSLLITDLDQDGSQELISYVSTYISKDVTSSHETNLDYNAWQIQSRVRVIRLEAQLPKLYEALMRP